MILSVLRRMTPGWSVSGAAAPWTPGPTIELVEGASTSVAPSPSSTAPRPAGATPGPPCPPGLAATATAAAPARSMFLLRRQRLAEAFTPTRPQLAPNLPTGRQLGAVPPGGEGCFVGRRAELARMLRALREDRAHIVLYGERGRGKTSLANLAAEEARRAGFPVARTVCSAASDLASVLRGLARDLPTRSIGAIAAPSEAGTAAPRATCEELLPEGPLRPEDVLALAPRQPNVRPLLVVDEFDRIGDEATRTGLADAIKRISDQGVALSFMIIGVSDSLEHLLGRHPSIQRCVTPIPLPLLGPAEVEDIVARGARQAGLNYPPAVRAVIASLSRGVPYIAQLLALRAGQAALDRGSEVVGGPDLSAAIAAAVEETDPRIVVLYESLTRGGRDTAMVALLRAATAGQQDDFGRFRATSERTDSGGAGNGAAPRVAGVPAAPALWRRLLEAGAVRPCVGAGPDLFTFAEAMLPHYVLLRAVRDAAVTR